MTTLEMGLDPELLRAAMEFAGDIDEFERHHAVDGLCLARLFRPDDPAPDPELEVLLAAAIAVWFWIDDRSDKHVRSAASPVDFSDLVVRLEADFSSGPPSADGPEERYFRRLAGGLAARATRREEYEWWRHTAARSLEALHAEERATRGPAALSYSECLEYGGVTTMIPSIIAASCLLHGLDRPGRQRDHRVSDLERHFSMQQRFINDIRSAPKERGEDTMAANLVRALEDAMPAEDALRFAGEQVDAYGRLANGCMALLGAADPIVQIVKNAERGLAEWYRGGPTRYEY